MAAADARTDPADCTERVRELLEMPSRARDDTWRTRLLDDIADARVVLTEPGVAPGPDGLPYGRVHLAPRGGSRPTTTVRRLADRATEKGYGLVVALAPDASAPHAWVFRYGDLWSLRAYGGFDGDGGSGSARYDDLGHRMPARGSGENGDEKVVEAAPTESVFPVWARRVIGRWMVNRLGVVEPRAKLFLVPNADPHRNLVFNVDLPPGTSTPEHAAMKAIGGWFLPRGLGLYVLAPNQLFDLEPSALLLDDF